MKVIGHGRGLSKLRSASDAYDLAVIGAGSAGFSAAIAAADLGARVALIGNGAIGGTCVNIGCVPSKTLLRAAELLHRARTTSRFAGIASAAQMVDWPALIEQKDALVDAMRRAKYVSLLKSYDAITYLEGRAWLVQGGVEVEGRPIAAHRRLIATGARPAVPSIDGIDRAPYLTSTSALALERLPKSLLVIGGGFIGCELGQLFARAGVKVTIACRSKLVPQSEPEIGNALAGYFGQEGITVRGGLVYRQIRFVESGVALEATERDEPVTLMANQMLIATGRRPNTEDMGLIEAGVALKSNGGIWVDDHMRTTSPDIYAAGDVTGTDEFVYMAAYGARIAAQNALNGDTLPYDNTAMPSVVFTDPQVASVGLTEAAARAAGHEIKVSLLSLNQVPRALAVHDTRGLIKLVASAKTDRLLGAHILAPGGADSIQTAVLAIKRGLTVCELAATVFPFLTTVEGLKIAAQAFDTDVTKLSCCAG